MRGRPSVTTPLFAGRGVPWVPGYENWRGAIRGEKSAPNVDNFFQPASYFGTQPANTIGNQTRLNSRLRELPSLNKRLSISKEFPLRAGMRFELRGEAFNIFNRVRLTVDNTNVTGATFGRVTGVYNSPCQIQVGAKFVF